MKSRTIFLFSVTTLIACSLAAASAPNKTTAPPDPGWPRQKTSEQGTLIYYQPQVDEWKDFKELDFRMAFSFTPKGGKEVVGILVGANTDRREYGRSHGPAQ